jgi:dihydropteroate synthase
MKDNLEACHGVRLKTKIMGIINITPDSFYVGSRAYGEMAIERAFSMCDQGADIVDIGGQSTRPGSEPISPQEELLRITPIIDKLATRIKCKLSIDTYNYKVAEYAADCGVQIINDINGMRSKAMRELVSDNKLECVIMHMQGSPKTMQVAPHYRNVVLDIKEFLAKRIKLCEEEGIKKSNIIIDPGIGFGKTLEHNLEIIKNIGDFKTFEKRVLLGVSRKGFIGKIDRTIYGPEERLEGSLAVACYCTLKGVDILRVHDVKETIRAVKIIDKLI